jgi:Na+-transporting methylmalonyl-CoA/oxaloacetate decarboxylase beta subunit
MELKEKKILKIATYASGAITILLGLLYIFINFIFPSFLKISETKGDAVTIIGGADGPTVIFLASKTTEGISLEIFILIFAVITIILFLLNKYRKTNN